MKSISICFMLALFFIAASLAGAASSPMVERHIFMPEAPGPETKDKLKTKDLDTKLDKVLDFSGVIIKGNEKKALIRNKRNKGGILVVKEGEELLGMTIKEIHSNYIVLNNPEKTIRLKLYTAKKNRPAPPVQPAVNLPVPKTKASTGKKGAASQNQNKRKNQQKGAAAANQAQANNPFFKALQQARQQKAQRAAQGQGQGQASANPFAQALQQSQQGGAQNRPASSENAKNLFLEAIRRAQEAGN